MALRCSPGVTASGIVAILGSALLAVAAVFMIASTFLVPARPVEPPYAQAIIVAMGFVLLGFAAWGITTSIGLFRLRGWSRWSIVAFSAMLAFVGVSSAGAMLIVPMPPPANVSPEFMAGMKFGLAGFYGVLAALGGFWLYYFNSRSVRAQFAGEGAPAPGGRPLSVSIVAWFLIAGSPISAVLALISFPGAFFGIAVTGWPARLFYLATAVVELWVGAGLLRLKPVSRLAAIAFFAYGILSSLIFAFLPGYPERMSELSATFPAFIRDAAQTAPVMPPAATVLFGALPGILTIWFLIARRGAFGRPAGPPPLPLSGGA